MIYNEEKAKDLAQATFLGGAILSSEWLTVTMTIENDEDIWERTPPVRTFLIPYGKENFKIESMGIKWNKNIWALPIMIAKENINKFLMVDNRAGCYQSGIESGKSEEPIRIDGYIQSSSNFKDLKNIHGTIYAAGNFRQVLRRDGESLWSDISEGEIQEEAKKRYRDTFLLLNTYASGFKCIDGFEADKNLYAAGESSDVWKYTGKSWIPIDIGILDQNIISICCAEDGFVYLGTLEGKLIKGLNDNWEEIKTPFETYPLTAIDYFEEKIYLATSNRLYEYNQHKISKVEYKTKDGKVPRRSGHLDVRHGHLLSVGGSSIALYNGKEWNILYGASSEDFQSVIDDMVEDE